MRKGAVNSQLASPFDTITPRRVATAGVSYVGFAGPAAKPGGLVVRFRLTEQVEHALLALVRLSQHCCRSLREDLGCGQLGRFS